MIMYLYTAHIPIQLMAVNNSLLVGGDIGRQLVKVPLAAALNAQLISPTQLTHAYEGRKDRRPDHNTGNSLPYSFRIVCGFFNIPQCYFYQQEL